MQKTVKLLISRKNYKRLKRNTDWIYHLSEGFGTDVLSIKPIKNIFGFTKYYRMKMKSIHTQKYLVNLLLK